MAKHPMSDDDLLAYAAGELPPSHAQEVHLHLAHCTDCRITVERTDTTMQQFAVAGTRLLEPPAATFELARMLLRAVRPDLVASKPPARVTSLRLILATLVFDSQQEFAFAGLRSVADATRQLSYENEVADLDLQIAPHDMPETGERRWRVMGQLTTDTPAPGLTAEIVPLPELVGGEAGASLRASLDEVGYFTIELPADRYALRIPIGDSVLQFPDLDLR